MPTYLSSHRHVIDSSNKIFFISSEMYSTNVLSGIIAGLILSLYILFNLSVVGWCKEMPIHGFCVCGASLIKAFIVMTLLTFSGSIYCNMVQLWNFFHPEGIIKSILSFKSVCTVQILNVCKTKLDIPLVRVFLYKLS